MGQDVEMKPADPAPVSALSRKHPNTPYLKLPLSLGGLLMSGQERALGFDDDDDDVMLQQS